jgi:MATE family multidrug resistance protein
MAIAFALAGTAIIAVMTTAEPVRAAAATYLPWMVAAPLLGLAPWMLDGIFIGATRTRDMRNMMAVSAAIYAVSVIVLLPLMGNHGLWLSLLISFLARGLTLGLRYPALEADAARP